MLKKLGMNPPKSTKSLARRKSSTLDGAKNISPTPSPTRKLPLIKNLSLEEFLNNLDLEFLLQQVNLQNHGIHDLKGTLTLFKQYKQPNFDDMAIVDVLLQKWAKQAQIPWSKSEIQGANSYVKTAIAAAGFFNPKNAITEPPMVASAGFCLCILYLDDILDKSGGFGGTASAASTVEFKNVFLQTAFDIMDNKYSSIDQLPSIMPSLDPVYKLMFLSFTYGVTSLPNYNSATSKYFRKSFLNDSVAALLMKDTHYGQLYSDEVYKMLRPRDGGFYTVLELILLARGVVLPKPVRKHLLFNIVMHLGASVLSLTNDMLGLEKEVVDGNDNDNLVLRIVKNEGIGIVEAFVKVNTIIQDQRTDIDLTCDKLLDEFPNNDDELTEFIDIFQTFLDGHVYFSQYTGRYGDMSFNLKAKQRKVKTVTI